MLRTSKSAFLAVSAALLAPWSQSRGEITYVDVPDTVVPDGGGNIDLGGNGTIDLSWSEWIYDGGRPCFCSGTESLVNALAGAGTAATSGLTVAFESGQSIGPSEVYATESSMMTSFGVSFS